MAKTNFTVVRNAAYRGGDFKTRQRHNERENESYQNGDVVLERSNLNVQFQQNLSPDGAPETYEQTFNRLLETGAIVKKGLKADAKLFDELVFDVNTDYFEQNGGYDYALKFYAEAYRLAVAEVGGEEYIISAVMHADERNKALSEQLGRDVYHYHLHVVYVPVVQKEVYYQKSNRNAELAGKLKEVIPQISHSKKWPKIKTADEHGKTRLVNSYSLLQDRYFEQMKSAGFDGFERGERGSTAEHLDVIDYKIQQDEKRLEVLDERIEKKEARVERLDEKIEVKSKAKATLAEIDGMGKPAILGGVNFSEDEAKRLKALAKKGVGIDKRAEEYRKKIAALDENIRELKSEIDNQKQNVRSIARDRDTWKANYERLWGEVKDFIWAIRTAPQKLLALIREHIPQKSKNREETL
jgi:prefoldin subunit 5